MCQVLKIATFLSTTVSIALDFRPVIINISNIALLDTNFGLHFLGFYLTKNASFSEFWVQVKSTFQISNFISMIIFLYLKNVLVMDLKLFATQSFEFGGVQYDRWREGSDRHRCWNIHENLFSCYRGSQVWRYDYKSKYSERHCIYMYMTPLFITLF